MKRLRAYLPLIFLLGGGTAHAQMPLQYSRIAYSSILDSALEKFAGIESGLAVPLKILQEKPERVKKILRSRAKGNRLFLDNEKEGSEFLSRLYRIDIKTAAESYRASMPAFTRTGLPTDEEIKEHLTAEAQVLKLSEPVSAGKIFDFSLQREVLRELGIK